MRQLISILVTFLATTAGANAALTIDTGSGYFGGYAGQFGEEGWNTTRGQTFAVTSPNSRLVDFTFTMANQTTNVPRENIHFSLYVAQWDNTAHQAVGPVLYKSPEQTYVGTVGFLSTQAFSFNIGVNLTPGAQYVAFISTIEYLDGPPYVSGVPATYEGLTSLAFGSSYPDGAYVAFNLFNGAVPTFGQLFTTEWDTFLSPFYDFYFIANFSEPTAVDPPATTPEPATLAIWGIGTLGCAVAGHRRRQNARLAG